MKLKYFIPFFLTVVAAVFTSCSDDNDPTYFDEIRVSQSYVSLSTSGGSASIDIKTSGDWQFEKKFKVTTKDANGNNVDNYYETPEWLSVNQTSGGAGQSTLTFSAEAGEGRNAELLISCEGKTQHIYIIQGIASVSNATCAEVLAGPDSKTYRVTGTVTKIVNTTYGNWYLNDGTGEVYIYGTLDAKGGTKNFLSWGLEVGDQITVEGPKTTYNGTVELVDVTVVKIEKSLIKCDSLTVNGIKADVLPLEGGDIVAHLTCKGTGVAVEIPADAQQWLGVVSSTVGENPIVTFRALPNTGGERGTTVTFKTTDGKKNYTAEATITQKGAVVAVNVADFIAAEIGDAQYRITGVVTGLYSSDSQGQSFYITDYSGTVLVYRAAGFKESGAKLGDVVTVVGKRTAYKDTPQMGSGLFEEITHAVTKVTIAEFLTKEDNPDVYYMVTGTVDEIVNETYGNLYLRDGENRLYTYGCYPGWGATGDNRKECIAEVGIEIGDQLTIIGPKSTYKDVPQVNGGIYFSHEKGQ